MIWIGIAGAACAQIYPTRMEANLGILPIDLYTTPQYTDLFPGVSCHTVGGMTPQTCIQQFLANYQAQGALEFDSNLRSAMASGRSHQLA
jgi:hypothetical protein